MSDLAKAFAGLKQAQAPESPGTQAPRRVITQELKKPGPRLAPLPLPATAKNSHPDYKAVKVFVRRETHKRASRKWEDQDAGDFSDLVEKLLQMYLDVP